MNKTQFLMIQGTNSDAGKSILVTAFCRIFSKAGYKTAPFKSQNMALNSYITLDGLEIGRAQGVQAEAAGVIATTNMNPILIKPNRETDSQIVVHGKPFRNMDAMNYRKEFFQTGINLIKDSLHHLAKEYDKIVIEGAGSPAEINLNDRELVNMRVAKIANAPVIIVGDMEKGGVFASLVGTLSLLSEEDRNRVIGVIINKVIGDPADLQSGIEWFEKYTGKDVLGVVPYLPNLNIEAEDSVALKQFTSSEDPDKSIDVAVIKYPKISNFTDVDPFLVEPDCHVRFVKRAEELNEPDLIILPGSKNTIEDFLFLEKSGLSRKIMDLYRKKKSIIFGICGGYQMLGRKISDPDNVESDIKNISGLCLLPLETIMTTEKTTVQSNGCLKYKEQLFEVTGYEIHMGQTKMTSDAESFILTTTGVEGCKDEEERVLGTYFHGIFHNDLFRTFFLNEIRTNKGVSVIDECILYNQIREDAFDQLAKHVSNHVHLKKIENKMREFSNNQC